MYTSGTSGLPVCIVEDEWLRNGSTVCSAQNKTMVVCHAIEIINL